MQSCQSQVLLNWHSLLTTWPCGRNGCIHVTEPMLFIMWLGDLVDKSKSQIDCNLLGGTSVQLGNFMLGVYSIYIGYGVLW